MRLTLSNKPNDGQGKKKSLHRRMWMRSNVEITLAGNSRPRLCERLGGFLREIDVLLFFLLVFWNHSLDRSLTQGMQHLA